MGFIHMIVRGVQIIFGGVILGLTGELVAQNYHGSAPAITNFDLFCGLLGALVGIIGIIAFFFESMSGLPMLIADGITTLFYLSGACATAAILKVGSCSNSLYVHTNSMINGGYYWVENGVPLKAPIKYNWQGRCEMAQAITAFLFFNLALFIASIVMDFMGGKGRRGGVSAA